MSSRNFYDTVFRNGGDDIGRILNSAKNRIKQNVAARNKKQNMQSLEDRLTAMFYPPNGGDGSESIAAFNTALAKMYEEKSGIALANFNVGNVQYKTSIPDPSEIEHSATVGRLTKIANNIIQTLERMNGGKSLPADLQKIEDQVKAAQIAIGEISREYGLSESSWLKSKATMGADKNNYISMNPQEVINILLSVDKALNKGAVNAKGYGDILEYALSLFNLDIENATNATIPQLISFMTGGDAVKGADIVSRGGGLIDTAISIQAQDLFKDSNQKKNNAVSMTIGNVTVKSTPSIATNLDKQGKVDVVIDIPDNVGGGNYRISAKNWMTIDQLRNLGGTSILAALSRSSGGVVDDFTYALQDKQQRFQSIAHDLAKLAIVADVTMGYSQKSAYADTLIINDRIGRRILVENIPEMIIDAANGLSQKLTLEGYPGGEMEEAAMNVRTKIAKAKLKNPDADYRAIVKTYLNAIRVRVRYSPM